MLETSTIHNQFNYQKNNKEMIALLTFLHFKNYGTMLQAYALQRKINDLGYECEYIDYGGHFVPKGLRKYLGLIKKIIISQIPDGKGVDSERFYYTLRFRRFVKGINAFKKEFLRINPKTFSTSDLKVINKEYEKFVVGSDQTWRIKNNDFYFLSFVEDNQKKMAYAPSFGTLHFTDEAIQFIKKKIGSFHCLSCRERANAVRLTNELGEKVEFVLDPTMLITSEEWKAMEVPFVGMPNRFILCYILGEKECISDFAEKLGKKYKLDVYYIMTRPMYATRKHVIKDATPLQFLYLVRNCTYMITDSFHGTIFSINFSTQFFAFNKREGGGSMGDNDRILEILKEFELEERLCTEGIERDYFKDIDYNKVQSTLSLLRDHSIAYLHNILNS